MTIDGNSGNVNMYGDVIANHNCSVLNILNSTNTLITNSCSNFGDESLTNLKVNGMSIFGSNIVLKNATGSATIYSYGVNIGINQALPSYMLQVGGSIFSSGDVTALSDARYKTNVHKLQNSLDTVCRMNGYSFNRVDQEDQEKEHIGLVAQEVMEILPSIVDYDKTNDIYSIKYGNSVAVIIEAIKQLRGEMNELKELIKKCQV